MNTTNTNPQNDPDSQNQNLHIAQEEVQFLNDPTSIPSGKTKTPKYHLNPLTLFDKSSWLKGLTAAFFITTLTSSALAFHYFNQNQKLLLSTSQKSGGQVLGASQEIQKLLEEVGKYITLPTNETPTIATVSDPSKLKEQPFFAKSEIGDKALIFPSSNRAILYRPKEHKIIEISTLDTSPTTSQNSSPTPENSPETKEVSPSPTN